MLRLTFVFAQERRRMKELLIAVISVVLTYVVTSHWVAYNQAFVNGQVSVMEKVCPSTVEKVTVKGKKG